MCRSLIIRKDSIFASLQRGVTNVSTIVGSVELTLTYGKPGELGRTTKPQKYSVVMTQMHTCYTVLITPLEIGVDLLKAPGLTRARIQLTDGTVIEGDVRAVQNNYFEVLKDYRQA